MAELNEGELKKRLVDAYSTSLKQEDGALSEGEYEHHILTPILEEAKKEIFSVWFERKSPEDIQNALLKWFGSL